jgi:glycosyltransferase involved in cell wall biosynthesis
MKGKRKLYIVGTHGVPARYGGFETLAEMLCQNLGNKFDITVYCNADLYPEKEKQFHSAKLIYVPIKASGFSGIIYDLITYLHSLAKSDVILYLSPVGSGFMTPLKLFTKKKVIVNHGGLNEWEREKLSFFKKKWAKFNHKVASRFANVNIADNSVYQQSLKENFNAESVVIKYGGNHVNQIGADNKLLFEKYPFVKEKYAASVSRAQVDNNLHLVLEAFEKFTDFKLVLISNWEVSEYGKNLKKKYQNQPNLILLDAIYDKKELDFIRGNSYVYIHSHSRCGTAPSLVEAMCLNRPVISFDVETNRETTQNSAVYFSDADSLVEILKNITTGELDRIGADLNTIATKEYSWEKISSEYTTLIDS